MSTIDNKCELQRTSINNTERTQDCLPKWIRGKVLHYEMAAGNCWVRPTIYPAKADIKFAQVMMDPMLPAAEGSQPKIHGYHYR